MAVGYVSIGVQYRLSGQAKWPAQIEDVKAAIRWTRANASRLGIDADRIAVAGYSAGGFLALTAAGTADKKEFEGNGGNVGVSTKLAGCVAFFASTSRIRRAVSPGNGSDDDRCFKRVELHLAYVRSKRSSCMAWLT